MTNRIAENEHVLRYCTPGKTENGLPLWEAFRPQNKSLKKLSVNWVEHYGNNYSHAVDRIREDFGKFYGLSRDGLFVMLHIASTKKYIAQKGVKHSLEFKKDPHPHNPSHAVIYGISVNDRKVMGVLAEASKSCKKYPGLI